MTAATPGSFRIMLDERLAECLHEHRSCSTPADAAVSTEPADLPAGDSSARCYWLSTWMIHNANHLRTHRDGLKWGATRRRVPRWSRS